MKGNSRTLKRKKTFLLILEKTAGNISQACRQANLDRKTIYRWMESDPDFKSRVQDIQEALLDFAESQLLKQIREGNITAIIFYLKTRGKSRGYTEKTELHHSGEVENKVKVEFVDTEEKHGKAKGKSSK